MRRFLDQPIWVRVLRGILLAGLVALIAVYTPTPYLLEAPGRAVQVSSVIDIDDKRAHPVNGEFLMTTVLLEKATLMLCVYGLLDPDATLTWTARQTPGDHAQSPADSRQMELSQYLSTRVALEKLGYQVRGTYRGLRVLGVEPRSPNINKLRQGDLLVEVNGAKLPTLEKLRELTATKSPGDHLEATMERDSKRVSLSLGLAKFGDNTRMGVMLRPEFNDVKLPVAITYKSGDTSGASAGLVFALEIYDRLDAKDLAKGRVIAATGTLDRKGRVGGIEGLPFKLIAAERAGASLFLVPQENYDEVKNIGSRVKVVPVKTFQEALDALQ